MKEIDVDDWKTFQEKLRDLRDELGRGSSPLLFRGQGNSEWQLKTTLERAGRDRMRFSGYYELISRIRPAVETFTGSNWEFPDYDGGTGTSFQDYEDFRRFPPVDAYPYMVYLRHHGFPSPLLDWSNSPSVAAFFAFREPYPETGRRAIYAFCEMPKGLKAWSSSEPQIRRIGPYVRSHRRHFRQQCDYTCGCPLG